VTPGPRIGTRRGFGIRLESCTSSFGRRAPAPQSSPEGEQLLGDNPAPMTFDEALAALLALVGERVEVHVMNAGQTHTSWRPSAAGSTLATR
jgi:hypothetical protein